MDNGFDEAYRSFLEAYPGYSSTSRLDELRARDYERLDRLGHVYLDYTGGGLYSLSQVQAAPRTAAGQACFGNPHSDNPTSIGGHEPRRRGAGRGPAVLQRRPGDTASIFTPNASGALKLVGESYPFQPGGRFLLTYDNHNSVNGIREFARRHGAGVHYLPVLTPELRVDAEAVLEALCAKASRHAAPVRVSLRSRTSAACSTRSNGCRGLTTRAGT